MFHEFLSNLLYVDTELDEIHSDRNIVANIYGLLAVPLFSFFVHILCVVMNYTRLRAVKDTWLESHFYWQINTVLLSITIDTTGFIITLILMDFRVYILIHFLKYIWIICRVINGYLVLRKMKALACIWGS